HGREPHRPRRRPRRDVRARGTSGVGAGSRVARFVRSRTSKFASWCTRAVLAYGESGTSALLDLDGGARGFELGLDVLGFVLADVFLHDATGFHQVLGLLQAEARDGA